MMLVPEKQRVRIVQFDARTQEDAFSVSLEGLKGVCILLIGLRTLMLSVEPKRTRRGVCASTGGAQEKGAF